MVDFQGIPAAYLPGDASADKRKPPDGATGLTGPPMFSQRSSPGILQQPYQDYSTFPFQSSLFQSSSQAPSSPSQSPLHQSVEPVKVPNIALLQQKYGSLLQTLPGNLERVISQVGSFFFGQRKQTIEEEDLDKRRLNDFFKLDYLGERKVEPTHHSASGGSDD